MWGGEGRSIRVFRTLAETLDVSDAALANLAGISGATLTRRKRAGRLTSDESEHILRIAHLLELRDEDLPKDWRVRAVSEGARRAGDA